MALSGSNKKKRKAKRDFIFRSKTVKSKKRNILESIVFLFLGTNLLIFLRSLPSGFILERLSFPIWTKLYTSTIEILSTLGTIFSSIILLILLLLSLVLILIGSLKLIFIYNNNKNVKNNKNE